MSKTRAKLSTSLPCTSNRDGLPLSSSSRIAGWSNQLTSLLSILANAFATRSTKGRHSSFGSSSLPTWCRMFTLLCNCFANGIKTFGPWTCISLIAAIKLAFYFILCILGPRCPRNARTKHINSTPVVRTILWHLSKQRAIISRHIWVNFPGNTRRSWQLMDKTCGPRPGCPAF